MNPAPHPRSARAALVLASIGLLGSAPALGAGAARPDPRLTADRAAVSPGAALHLTGSGFPHRARIVLLAGARESDAKRIGSAVSGSRGGFLATVRVRQRAAAARIVVVACSDACRVRASARFRIARR